MHKTLFLTGAGFAYSWDGLLTKEVTKELISENEIFRMLFRHYESKGYVLNFEELLNIIELLFQKYYGEKFGKTNHDFVPIANVFDVQKDIAHFFELDLKLNEENTHLAISNLYFELIKGVVEIIRKYALSVKDGKHKELNTNLNMFISNANGNNPLRYYTTNYDRLVIDACPDIHFFDGFSVDEITDMDEIKKFRLQETSKILTDRHTNCHYNLHGSIYWDVVRKYSTPNIVCSKNTVVSDFSHYQNFTTLLDSNPKEFQLVSPIITGLQKIQRTNISPFNAMSASFLTDCFECDMWYILGYSFSDPHINNMLRTAMADKNTRPKKIVWVSYDEKNKTKIEQPISILPFRQTFTPQIDLESQDFVCIEEYSFYSEKDGLGLYFGGFSSFLEKEIWKQYK
ncbi:MAG: SIR2 family protein [Bacteroidales bacterium]|nr:SIR2 family protein [Bacteroidales bacterium]